MVRIACLVASLALAAPLFAACQAETPDDRGGSTYVALGDSYTAGPKIGTPDDTNGCLRSRNNYPHLLAERAGLELTDVSCSGATTDAIEGEQTVAGQPVDPQIDAVEKGTKLVTVGIGFNDLGLTVRVFITCVQIARQDPDGAPCTKADQAAGAKGIQNALDQMDAHLTGVVTAVRERAPEARIVLVGYPTIFPASKTCADLGIATGDLSLVNHVVESLNASMAQVARQHDATYVDTATPSEGHDICSSDPWIAGLKPAEGRPGFAWHPYAEEQEMVAGLLAKVVDH